MKYGIWNNKGGVGKTFLTFILGTEYASRNPEKHVILVDMCPQANLTEILLGGNRAGAELLEEILTQGPERCTVGGYFDRRIESPHKRSATESSYLIRGKDYNTHLPGNVWLIAGDPSLELQAQVISQIGSQTLPQAGWKNVRNWLNDLITVCTEKLGEATVFIDCNPSFSAYTELSVVASERLILPCSSDGSSARAISNVAALIYGHGIHKAHENVNFAYKAETFGLSLPLS